MLQQCACRDIEHLGSLERLELHSAAPRATLTPLSCSPNFPRAQYLDIRTLTHELIVNLHVQHQFFLHFFAIIFHDHNVKLSSHTYVLTKDFVTRLNVFLLAFFSLPLIFTLPASTY